MISRAEAFSEGQAFVKGFALMGWNKHIGFDFIILHSKVWGCHNP